MARTDFSSHVQESRVSVLAIMAVPGIPTLPATKEFVMRYSPAAAALALLAAVSSSVSYGADYEPDPLAAALVAAGKTKLQAGDTQGATDQFEAALTVDPGYSAIYLDLAEAARVEGLQGKAIHYYREAQERDPDNFAAISGEGEALLEKGALEKARVNLSKLESLCGESCAETRQLAAAIANDSRSMVLTAEAVTPEPVITQN
jgi:tetratricopeptide (TPR) repeat protein